MLINTKHQYGLITKVLHWFLLILLLLIIPLGLYMTRMDESPEQLLLINLHKSLGISILFLICIRFGWRLTNVEPMFLGTSKSLKFTSRLLHYLLYGLLLLIPLSGWTYSSALRYPVSFFGLFSLPDIVAKNKSIADVALLIHKSLVYTLIALIALHLSASLYHHFGLKDKTLKRMWFGKLDD